MTEARHSTKAEAHHGQRNRALVRFIALPMIFLTVALLGGLRVSAEDRVFVFIAPPLVTLILATLLMLLFVRGHLIELKAWLSSVHPALENISHALTLLTLFFASAQAFNSVLPERGLLFWLFSFFFLWTLWNNQFALFDAKRLLRSLTVLFGTAFVLKHMIIASLYAPDGGWLKRLTGALVEGVSLGTLDTQAFAPSTGYISFFTLALYVAGLILLPAVPLTTRDEDDRELLASDRQLPTVEGKQLREAMLEDQSELTDETIEIRHK
jgi:hypothetical protein